MAGKQKQSIERLRNVGLGYRKMELSQTFHGTKLETTANPMDWMGMQSSTCRSEKVSRWKKSAVILYVGNVADLSKGRKLVVENFIALINAGENGAKIIFRSRNMNVYFVEKNLKLCTKTKSFVAMIVIFMIGFGGSRTQWKQ